MSDFADPTEEQIKTCNDLEQLKKWFIASEESTRSDDAEAERLEEEIEKMQKRLHQLRRCSFMDRNRFSLRERIVNLVLGDKDE